MTVCAMVHVPYKDAQQRSPGLVAGAVDLLFDNMPAIVPHVRLQSARLAVTGPSVPGRSGVASSLSWRDWLRSNHFGGSDRAARNPERHCVAQRRVNSALMSPGLGKICWTWPRASGGTPGGFDTFIKKRPRSGRLVKLHALESIVVERPLLADCSPFTWS